MKENEGIMPSLFDWYEEGEGEKAQFEDKLAVVKATFQRVERKCWQELFDGFDELYAITFSSGVDFTSQLIDKFEYAEIIYGCEAVLNPSVGVVMSVEKNMINKIKKCKGAKKCRNV